MAAATAIGTSLLFAGATITGAGAAKGSAAAAAGGALSGLGPRPGIGVETIVSSAAFNLRAVVSMRLVAGSALPAFTRRKASIISSEVCVRSSGSFASSLLISAW